MDSIVRDVKLKGANLIWADSRDHRTIRSFEEALNRVGYETRIRSVCGRSLLDQVWWKRWILTASLRRGMPFNWVLTDDEPCTPPLAVYPLEWLTEDALVETSRWEAGLLKLDSSMPFLGATKPKPAGTLQRPIEGRALVWDPKRPLPGLHEGSCEAGRKDRLLLLGKGPDGPAARAISPEEVVALTSGKKPSKGADTKEEMRKALNRPPRTLCDLSVQWAAAQVAEKVGVCQLRWEKESRNILEKWLLDNPAHLGSSVVGGKGKKARNKDLPINEQAMKAMSYVLRHPAGTPECPINEEGWVRWDDLRAHDSCRRFGGWTLCNAIEEDPKNRVIASPDEEGEWWVAAWSGHTQDKVVGPAAIVPPHELPAVLIHGSYKRHTASIQKKGLLRQSRDLHFHNPETASGKWRLDLETRIEVDVRRASEAGCVFRKTGNEVWLCDRGVPPEAIVMISAWEDPIDSTKGTPEAEGAASSGSQQRRREFNSAALDLRAYRSSNWQHKLKKKPATEEVAQIAIDLGKNLPDDAKKENRI